MKHPVTKSTKVRSKDKRSPIQAPLLQTPLQIKKAFKGEQKPKPKIQEKEKTEKMNKFRILEKMETESSPQLAKPKTQKNKPTNSPEQRINNEPLNNCCPD